MKSGRTARAVIAVSVVGVVLAGCSTSRTGSADAGDAGPESQAASARYTSSAELLERLSADGTTVVVGNPEARSVVHLLEDPRCPVVEEFERTGAKAVRKLVLSREIRVEYTFASFKDDRLGGDGSKRAVNALRAALDRGKFVEYHAVLFRNQVVVEGSGGFTTERLLKLADQVPGLRSAAFDAAVRTMKYKAFVTASEKAYENTGDDPNGPGTPSLVVNGHQLEGGLFAAAFREELLTRLVVDLHDRPARWSTFWVPFGQRVEAQWEAEESQES
ncbi:DsbA family protein [Streptomyces sp. NBC_00250]|uniref:DsbA family protein n=1 Tax=Streptomyces sp. NBC_00250 TaxID=2903641 RepID=UPI002E2E6A87|nr:thioredoxin domain-containing protein [Streptomyces sp. NBC_00250]